MLNVMTIMMSKMTSHCMGTVQMGEESESGIRKWEEMWLNTTTEDAERGGHFLFTCSDTYDCRMYHSARIHSVTDRQTDRQTTLSCQ